MEPDGEADVVTQRGRRIPRLELKQEHVLGRTVALFGPSGTGKTVVIKNIMRLLRDKVDQVIVVAPTEPANRSYDGFVDPVFIHYNPAVPDASGRPPTEAWKGMLNLLEAVWKRQEMLSGVAKRAASLPALSALFARLPAADQARGLRVVQRMGEKREKIRARLARELAGEPGRRAEEEKRVNARFRELLALLYRRHIRPRADELWNRDLSEDERFSLQYIDFNPRLLLVLDDCAAEYSQAFKRDVFRRLFYQGRHVNITFVLSLQDDTDLAANCRKNAFLSFFMTDVVCRANFGRVSNNYSKPTRQFVEEVADEVFVGHRKLAYLREDPSKQFFYHITFSVPRAFRFGSRAAQELCGAVQSAAGEMDKNNPYFRRFQPA